jgi:hypothetical protein
MAAPHVTAVAALVFNSRVSPFFDYNNNRRWDNNEVRDKMLATAFDLGDKGWDPSYGEGLVDAFRGSWRSGDFGSGVPAQFFAFDAQVNGVDLALFLECYKQQSVPPDAMYLADLGGGVTVPLFFLYDGKVDGKDLALFLQCYKGQGP